ncbi:HD domain-containing protein [Chitinophaga sp. 22620]|uniref:HD domain-containing protein n=1 Tax=Chitinophaga sp. 22620 TaxID=3453952 RepID=UPI003F851A1B
MQIDEIKNYWMLLSERSTADYNTSGPAIDRIIRQYGASGRYYHNTGHLSDLICFQQQYAPMIMDNDSMIYAIYFHDLIYRVTRKDNELKSAEEAAAYLTKIGYPEDKTQKVYRFILATAGHQNPLADPDLDFLLDFDLHILGALPDRYDAYTKQIRKEFDIYPGFMYRRGRKRVLQHFLAQPGIYRTSIFREKYELKARENLERELESL